MAKLSAHGYEVARYEKETETPNGQFTVWEKKTYAIMSDGRILSKNDAKFRPASWETKPRHHSWGWKRGKKVADTSFKTVEGIISFLISKGYAKV